MTESFSQYFHRCTRSILSWSSGTFIFSWQAFTTAITLSIESFSGTSILWIRILVCRLYCSYCCHIWFPTDLACLSVKQFALQAGPNADLLCVRQSDAAPFCENYTKLYFDVKHLEKGLNRRWWNFWWPFFQKSALFGQYRMLPWFRLAL